MTILHVQLQATNPTEDLYNYAQTKAATTNYVRSLAKQLTPKGIRVNRVALRPIWIPLQVSDSATREKLQKFGGQTPPADRVSRHNWLPFMYSLLPTMTAMLPGKYMVP